MQFIKIIIIMGVILSLAACGKNGPKQKYSPDYPRQYPEINHNVNNTPLQQK